MSDVQRDLIVVTGYWRVYFNKHGAEPLMWCISPDEGDWEIAVRDVQMTATAVTVYRPKPLQDDDDGKPSAWLFVTGTLTVNSSGFAVIA